MKRQKDGMTMQLQIPAVNEDQEHILSEVQCFALDMD